MRFGAGNKSNGEIGKQGGGNRRSVCVSFSRDSYCLSLFQRYRITRRFSIKCEYRGSCTHSSSSKVCKRFGRGLRLRTAEKWYSSRYSLNVSSRCARYHPADETETERSSIRSFLKFHKKRIIPYTNELILLSRRKRIVIVLSPRRTGRKQPLLLPPWIALHRRLPIQTLPSSPSLPEIATCDA